MAEEAQFLVTRALEYADRRGGRLRAITVTVPHEHLLGRVRAALRVAGLADVEVIWEVAEGALRLVAVEVDSAA